MEAAPAASSPAPAGGPDGASTEQPAVNPAAAVVAQITEKTLALAGPQPFGGAQRPHVQRTPAVCGKPIAVRVPGDSKANHMHDDELACKIAELAGGGVDVGMGAAALLAQRPLSFASAMDTTPTKAVPAPVFGGNFGGPP